MSTWRDLIKGSLRLIGAIAPAENLSADEQADAFKTLKAMLDSWSTEKLIASVITREELALIGSQASYTMGDGGDFDTVRPLRIENAAVLLNGTEIPVDILNADQWAAISQKDVQSSIPTKLYAEGTSPLETINLWPLPTGVATLVLYSWKPLSELAAVGDEITLPPGYERAIKYNLALELAPEYSREPSALVMNTAMEAKANIKRMNIKPSFLSTDVGLAGHKRFNIYTGE